MSSDTFCFGFFIYSLRSLFHLPTDFSQKKAHSDQTTLRALCKLWDFQERTSEFQELFLLVFVYFAGSFAIFPSLHVHLINVELSCHVSLLFSAKSTKRFSGEYLLLSNL